VLDVAGIEIEEVLYLLREALLIFTHACREIEIKVRWKQAVTFVRPGQRDLVEVLTDLASECPQIVEPAGAAQQLLVVAAGIDRCPVLAGDLMADLAIVFYRGPDADMDRGEHGAFSNHCKTSACSTPRRTNSGV
jgi:hypothetical protein